MKPERASGTKEELSGHGVRRGRRTSAVSLASAPALSSPPPITAALPASFFARPAERVAPELVGCLLLRQRPAGELLWGVVVETEAYCQSEPACHGHRRRSAANETLFGPPGRFYVYVSHGVHHCVNVVTDRDGWANGVLLRAVALPGEPDRVAAGPGLLARRFGIDRSHDRQPVAAAAGLWLTPRPPLLQRWWRQQERIGGSPLMAASRIGIALAQDLPWRWYLRASRSVSRRARGDRTPRPERAVDAVRLALGLPLPEGRP